MARTDDDLVKGVLRLGTENGDYDDVNNPSLTPYIRAANLVVTRVATCASNKGVTLSSDELTEIETWLAAHLYCMSDQTYLKKKTADAEGWFQGLTGMKLDGTKYGQTAQMIDVSGCLAAIGMAKRASATWLGRPPSEQTDYEDRD